MCAHIHYRCYTMKNYRYVFLLLFLWGCGKDHGHTDDHKSTIELEPLAFTVWTPKTELFVEFKPFVVGEHSKFAAHFTSMKTFKGLTKGSLKVELLNATNQYDALVEKPAHPGIFMPSIMASKEGMYQLRFILHSDAIYDTIILDSIRVYNDHQSALANAGINDEKQGISFLKEQAWKTDFAIEQVQKEEITEVVHTTGKLQNLPINDVVIAAKSRGVVIFNNTTVLGAKVDANQPLLRLTDKGIAEGNLSVKLLNAKAEYEKTKLAYERATILNKDSIITLKELEERRATYQIAKNEYDKLATLLGNGAQRITAPKQGYIKNIVVQEGQVVELGTPLMTITSNNKLVLEANVSQAYFSKITTFTSANFKMAGDDKVYRLGNLNGKVLSYGKSLNSDQNYLPIYFELDNKGELLTGALTEVYLKGTPQKATLVIPNSAIMEDYGNYYVFVQTAGESFEKRPIQGGITDGNKTAVLSGLKEGEWIVTRGAYQIKVASMSSTIPAHSH